MSHLPAIFVAFAVIFVFSNTSKTDAAPQFANANAQASAGRFGANNYGGGFGARRYGPGFNQGYGQRFGPGGFGQGGFGQGGFGQGGLGQGGSLSISKSISISRGGAAQSSSNAAASGK